MTVMTPEDVLRKAPVVPVVVIEDVRAIAGLWYAGSGTISRPPAKDILFLPQHQYGRVAGGVGLGAAAFLGQ